HVGLLVTDVTRAYIEDDAVRVIEEGHAPSGIDDLPLIAKTRLRHSLISDAAIGALTTAEPSKVTLTSGRHIINFLTPAAIAPAWATALAKAKPAIES